ncbi:hypothetical protein B7G54_02090 [Burkholderia puraquae]|uniref:Uncharacterized protein n=1 Tax=Burkholderia puraquae TaxID=1904757 RepID=A0A1X1PQB3_9BURK|nr:hypothetical protein B7G54_02090 [Burkholderia puraquae]
MCRFGQIVLRHENVSRLLGGDGGCGASPRDGVCDWSAGCGGAQDGTRERSARRCRDASERR